MLRILPLNEAQRLITRKAVRLSEAEQVVGPILEAVRKRGDEAVLEFARKFDSLAADNFTVPASDWQAAESRVTPEFYDALEIAATNIREYAVLQLPRETSILFPDGRRLGRGAAARIDGRIHSGRALSAAFDIADDRDSRAGGRRADNLRYLAAPER